MSLCERCCAESLGGLGIQLGVTHLGLALALLGIAGLSGGGSLALLGLGVPTLLLLASYLRSEARRRLRTMRLAA